MKPKSQSFIQNNKIDKELNAIYIERLERLMTLIELSYTLKNTTKIIKGK